MKQPRFFRPDDVDLVVEHQRNCLCVLNEDGSVRAVELRCIRAYVVADAK